MSVTTVGLGGYIRPTWRQAVADYLPEDWRGERADRWIGRLPVIVVLAIYTALSLRLHNTVFIDEARNINAGRSYLLQWINNGPRADHSAYFSGAPTVYPVIAAALDSAGGLELVRLFSLICMLVSIGLLHSTVKHVFSSPRVGLLAACAFVFTAPVVYVGALGTFDALCIMLITISVWVAVTKQSIASAATAGCLLALGVAVNYVAFIFVPFIFVIMLVTNSGILGPIRARRRRIRVAVLIGTTDGLLASLYVTAGDSLRKGVSFAVTSERAPTSVQGAATLAGWATLNIGLLTILGVIGAIALVWRTRSMLSASVGLSLLSAAALLPLTEMWLGAEAPFDSHNAYSALFLAPLAAWALASLSRRLFRLGPVALILLAALAPTVSRSDYLFHSWADVTPVLEVIDKDPQQGLYLSAASDTLNYYTGRNSTGIQWEAASKLYAQGNAAIHTAIEQRKYQMIIVRSVSTASPAQTFLLKSLEVSADYEPVGLVRSDESAGDRWLVYRVVNPLR
jgi:hypothetical protein